MSEETWEWPEFGELLILDGSLDTRTSVDECPKCAAIVRTEARNRHERVCWGKVFSEDYTPANPFQHNDPVHHRYVEMLHRLLESAPELGEHTVRSREFHAERRTVFRTTFYGKDFLITIERAVHGG